MKKIMFSIFNADDDDVYLYTFDLLSEIVGENDEVIKVLKYYFVTS